MTLATKMSATARRVPVICALVVLSACTDSGVTSPPVPDQVPTGARAVEIRCVAMVRTGDIACAPTGPVSSGLVTAAAPRFTLAGSSAPTPSIIMGGQGTYVLLENDDSQTSYDPGTQVFTTMVTVKNLIAQPIGTTDGTTPAIEGVRVFFNRTARAKVGTGPVTLLNADGTDGTYTASNQSYFAYPGILTQDQTSAAKEWRWNVDPDVTEFEFSVYVWAPVEYPDGYVTVDPAAVELEIGSGTLTHQLTAQVYDALGVLQAGAPVTWGSSAAAVASVTGSGLVTAEATGTATITATSGSLSGTSAITVTQPASLTHSLVEADPESIVANGSSTSEITVTLRDGAGDPLSASGGVVTLTHTGTGSLTGVTDNGDGSYTATLTAPAALGSAVIGAELDGDPLTDDVTVAFTAGAPAGIGVVSGDMTPDPGQTVTLFAQVKDANGHNVPGVREVTWSSTNGGTFDTDNTSDTDASGLATKNFTVSSAGGVVHVVTAGAAGVDGDVTLTLSNAAPVPAAKAYDALSNVTLNGTGLLAGATDADLGSGSLATVAETRATTQAGSVTIATDGTFAYHSAPGFTGSDQFVFKVRDPGGAEGSATATITIAAADVYWFVDNSYAGGGSDGTDVKPFTTVVPAVAAATSGETVLVRNGTGSAYTGNFTLPAGVLIRGNGASAFQRTVNSVVVTLLPAGTVPTVGGATVVSNNTITSLALAPAGAAGISGNAFGTLTLDAVSINATNGAALDLTTGSIAATNIGNVASSGTAVHGIRLSAVTGSLATAGGAISAGSTAAISINGGSVSLTHAGSVSQGSNAPALNVTGGHTGTLVLTGAVGATSGSGLQFNDADGTYTLSGPITLNAPDAGIDVLNGSSGAIAFSGTPKSIATSGSSDAVSIGGSAGSVSFTNGGLAISTAAGAGFSASGGATITVSGAGNTISSGTGTALNLDGVVGGAAGVTFQSIAANGALNGIRLSSVTGIGLTVTGSGGAAGSGGTIQNTTGAAVSIATAPSTSLAFMNLNAGLGGIVASTFNTLTVNGVSVASGAAAALSLNTGTMSGTFSSLGSTGGVNAVTMTAVNGSFSASAGSLSGATGATINVSAGSIAATFSGSVSQANNAALVSVAGAHNGSLTFNTGTISASNGTGLQFDNADGTYSFNGTTTLQGGDAAIDITNGSAGTFTFGAGTLVNNPTGTAFNVSASTPNVTFSGSLFRTANNALLVGMTGVASGNIAFDPAFGTDSLYATIGDGIQLSNVDAAVDFNGRVRLAGGNAAVDIIGGSSGNIDFDATTIVNPTGEALRIFNGSGGDQPADVSFAGVISTNASRPVLVEDISGGTVAISASIATTAQGILVQNNSGGSITFSSATQSLNTAANAAVTLTSNAGATIDFTGGNLDIDVTSGAGFSATGGGTVTVTGAGNTVTSGTGTALNISNTNIGVGGLTFRSIASSGATNGIVLNNTGIANGLTVTGAGGAGSGGTITGSTGDAVSLATTRNVRLTSMNIQNSGQSGIYGTSVTNFSLKSSTVSGNGNAVGEAGIEFDNLWGTDSIFNSTVSGSAEDNIVVRNSSGTLDSLVVVGNGISSNSSIGSDGILLTALGTANATIRVRNNTFTANKGDHFQATASNSAILNVVLFQNTMTGGHPTALGQGVTLGTGLSFTGTFTYDLNDNDILNGPISNAITIDHDGTTGSLMQGRVRNNVIGTSGSDLSCSTQASGIEIENGNRGTHTYAVTGNTVRRCFDRGIFLDNGDGSSVVVNATVTGNVVNELTTANARQALYVNVGSFDPNFLGSTDSFTVCADIQGNTLASHASYSTEAIRLRMRFNSRMNLPGYSGSFNNAGNEVNAYLGGRNTLTGSATATTTASGAPYGYYSTTSCPTPP